MQTGGSGETWKRYLDPRGSGSGYPAGLYWGWVTIPGAYYADKPEQPVTRVPLGDIVFGKHTLKIAALGDPADFVQPLDLIVGYTDDEYGDNGYYNHDDGNDNQCSLDHDGGSAWLTLSVNHGTPGPIAGAAPQAVRPRAHRVRQQPAVPGPGVGLAGQRRDGGQRGELRQAVLHGPALHLADHRRGPHRLGPVRDLRALRR